MKNSTFFIVSLVAVGLGCLLVSSTASALTYSIANIYPSDSAGNVEQRPVIEFDLNVEEEEDNKCWWWMYGSNDQWESNFFIASNYDVLDISARPNGTVNTRYYVAFTTPDFDTWATSTVFQWKIYIVDYEDNTWWFGPYAFETSATNISFPHWKPVLFHNEFIYNATGWHNHTKNYSGFVVNATYYGNTTVCGNTSLTVYNNTVNVTGKYETSYSSVTGNKIWMNYTGIGGSNITNVTGYTENEVAQSCVVIGAVVLFGYAWFKDEVF